MWGSVLMILAFGVAILLWVAAPTILLWWLLIGVWPWQ